jgi:hypothetical protein
VQEVGGAQNMKASLPIVVVTVPHEEDEELGVRGEGWQNRYNHYKFRLVAAKQSLFCNIFLEMSKRNLESVKVYCSTNFSQLPKPAQPNSCTTNKI